MYEWSRLASIPTTAYTSNVLERGVYPEIFPKGRTVHDEQEGIRVLVEEAALKYSYILVSPSYSLLSRTHFSIDYRVQHTSCLREAIPGPNTRRPPLFRTYGDHHRQHFNLDREGGDLSPERSTLRTSSSLQIRYALVHDCSRITEYPS